MNAVITEDALAALARAYKRAERNAITATLIEQADGVDRWTASCNGSCGTADLIEHAHDVAVWYDHRVTCDCPTSPGLICQHFAAVAAHDAFRFPEAPRTCEALGCGASPAMYLMGGDGHRLDCPRHGMGEPAERPASRLGRRVADELAAAEAPTPANVTQLPAPKRKGRVKSRLELQQETRPEIRMTPDGFLEVRRMPCAHVVAIVAPDEEWTPLPLSWNEGCPECNDRMLPPAEDQVVSR